MKKTTRRNFLERLGAIAGYFTLSSCSEPKTTVLKKRAEKIDKKLKRRYDTIAHSFLDVETKHGTCRDEHYGMLDDIIDRCVNAIGNKTSDEDYLFALKSIDGVLKNEFVIAVTDTMSEALDRNSIDCDISSAIYLGVGEVVGLPLKISLAPYHAFVRWHFTHAIYRNWDVNEGLLLTNKDYLDENYGEQQGIDIQSVKKGSYLRSLSREEVVSLAYFGSGADYWRKKNISGAFDCFYRSSLINSRFAESWAWQAKIQHILGNQEAAKKAYNTALELNPREVNATKGLKILKHEMQKSRK